MLLISSADKLDNAKAILTDYNKVGDALWARFNKGRRGQLWYYQRLVKAYRTAGFSNPVTKELEQVVDELVNSVCRVNNTKKK